MNKKLFVLLGVLALLAVTLVPVLARPDASHADGVWCYTPNVDSIAVVPIDPNYMPAGKLYLSATYNSEWTGTFNGSSRDAGMLVSHLPEGVPPPGNPMTFIGTAIFDEVQVGDATGGLEMDAIGYRMKATSDWKGTWIITGGTGKLKGIKGFGAFWGPGWLGNPDECGVIYYKVFAMRQLSLGKD